MYPTLTLPTDGNGRVIPNRTAFQAEKSIAFTGAAGLGAQGAITLFTVTGDILLSIFAVCSEDLAGASATIATGISGNTAALIAQATATDLDNGEIWIDATPATIEALPDPRIITGGADVIATIATANITDGTLKWYALWSPLSSDGNLVAA